MTTTDPSAARRRELSRAARDAFPPMGVHALRDSARGTVRVRASRNVHGAINRDHFALRLGSHPDKALQRAPRRGLRGRSLALQLRPGSLAGNPVIFRRAAAYPGATLWLYGSRDSFYSLRHSRANFEASWLFLERRNRSRLTGGRMPHARRHRFTRFPG